MTAKPVSVSYKKELLKLVNDLTTINNQILITKSSDKETISIIRANPSNSIAYRLSAPISSFGFSGNELAFYNYQEFYQLFSCFESPTLEQLENKLIITKDKAKINYIISDPTIIKKGPSKITFENPEISFELSDVQIEEIKKMIQLLISENIHLSSTGANVTVKIYNSGHDNSFEKQFTAKKAEAWDGFTIESDVFTLIPKASYTIDIMKAGMVRFTMKTTEANVEIFTGESTEEA